jgi:hypothetical protein
MKIMPEAIKIIQVRYIIASMTALHIGFIIFPYIEVSTKSQNVVILLAPRWQGRLPYVQYFVWPLSDEMKDLWRWEENKIKINTLHNAAVIKSEVFCEMLPKKNVEHLASQSHMKPWNYTPLSTVKAWHTRNNPKVSW